MMARAKALLCSSSEAAGFTSSKFCMMTSNKSSDANLPTLKYKNIINYSPANLLLSQVEVLAPQLVLAVLPPPLQGVHPQFLLLVFHSLQESLPHGMLIDSCLHIPG